MEWRDGIWHAEIVRLPYDRKRAEYDFIATGYLDTSGPVARPHAPTPRRVSGVHSAPTPLRPRVPRACPAFIPRPWCAPTPPRPARAWRSAFIPRPLRLRARAPHPPFAGIIQENGAAGCFQSGGGPPLQSASNSSIDSSTDSSPASTASRYRDTHV